MPLGKHTKNPTSGRIRQERADSLIKNLRKDYPILKGINVNKKLGTVEKELGVESLNQVLKVLRKNK